MKKFMDDNYALDNDTAVKLYHEYAKEMPVIDFHCHLPPRDIAEDRQFNNITEAWLEGDHYKWRAMRFNGVDERYCTGDASPFEKFQKWAETIPYAVRNQLYGWTHLELKRYFGIDQAIDGNSARDIYDQISEKLQSPEYSVRNLLRMMNVKAVCTTDDPAEELEHHEKIKNDNDCEILVAPTFRPDKAMAVSNPDAYNEYVDKLGKTADVDIRSYDDLKAAVKKRHDDFAELGCKMSDRGLEKVYAEEYTESEISNIFDKVRAGKQVTEEENMKFQSAMLVFFGQLDGEKNWVQQLHLGAMRNNNTRMFETLGPDTGFDSIGDFQQARDLSRFLDRLDVNNELPKTILYSLNPADNEILMTMAGNFNNSSIPGKVQLGTAWWFLDNKYGMEKQMNVLSKMGLISHFVGMLTDSRSFLSFPRHEYFRRILCNIFGHDIETGMLPDQTEWIGNIIQKICYYNPRDYIGLDL